MSETTYREQRKLCVPTNLHHLQVLSVIVITETTTCESIYLESVREEDLLEGGVADVWGHPHLGQIT